MEANDAFEHCALRVDAVRCWWTAPKRERDVISLREAATIIDVMNATAGVHAASGVPRVGGGWAIYHWPTFQHTNQSALGSRAVETARHFAAMGVLRCALLGTGGIANEFLAPALALAQNARLWSVLSRSKSSAEAFATRHGALSPTPAYDDLDQLLADPALDAVIIATPDRLHAAQCIAAAKAGKHVFCEKPLATSTTDARAMVAACDAAGVTLGVAYHLRHHAGHRALIEQVRRGAIGRVRHARVQWTFAAPDANNWRASADVGRWWALASVGTHGLDLLRWVMVEAVGEITTMKSLSSSPKFGAAHDESTMLSLKFADGSTGELFASVLFRAPRRIELFGDSGYAEAVGTLGPWGKGEIRINDTLLEYIPTNPYVGELDDFADAVARGRAPAVDGREGLRNVELLEMALPL